MFDRAPITRPLGHYRIVERSKQSRQARGALGRSSTHTFRGLILNWSRLRDTPKSRTMCLGECKIETNVSRRVQNRNQCVSVSAKSRNREQCVSATATPRPMYLGDCAVTVRYTRDKRFRPIRELI